MWFPRSVWLIIWTNKTCLRTFWRKTNRLSQPSVSTLIIFSAPRFVIALILTARGFANLA